jgi:uncharacterized protein YktB (UPF0637 family)
VAKHMRRSVNPPPDTWVAFNRVKRGYKATAHFSVGISGLGTNVAVIVKPESTEREEFASAMERNAAKLAERLTREKSFYAGDVARAEVGDLLPASDLDAEAWREQAERLRRVKSWAFEAGYRIKPQQSVKWEGEQYVKEALKRMRKMLPLYMCHEG